MMMVALSPDAQGHLAEYLRQVKAALASHSSVDVAEVERDVIGHIDAELTGEPEPIPAHRLLVVLDRLGEPREWVAQEQSLSRGTTADRQLGPADWVLPGAAFGSLLLAFILMLGRTMLWPMPLVLAAVSFVTARVTLGLLDHRGEALGLRGWLVYPSLLLVYVPLGVVLVGGPALPIANFLDQDAAARGQLAAFVGASPRLAVPGAIAVVLGCWWALLGLLATQFMATIAAVFRPFGAAIPRRHATRAAIAGVVLAVLGIAMLTLPRLLTATAYVQETDWRWFAIHARAARRVVPEVRLPRHEGSVQGLPDPGLGDRRSPGVAGARRDRVNRRASGRELTPVRSHSGLAGSFLG